MGCSLSIFRRLYSCSSLLPSGVVGPVGPERLLSFNGRRFRVLRTLGEGGYAFVYLVREIEDPNNVDSTRLVRPGERDYALKKILAQSKEQLEVAKSEIETNRRFVHLHLLSLLDSAVVPTSANGIKPEPGVLIRDPDLDNHDQPHNVFLLFPAFKDGTLQEVLAQAPLNTKCFTPLQVLGIFDQVCAALEEMHMADPPYAHWDIKPANVLLSLNGKNPDDDARSEEESYSFLRNERVTQDPETGQSGTPFAVLNDLGSARRARIHVNGRKDAMAIIEAAEQYASAPYRAPELWDIRSDAKLDERVDVWAMGCLLYALMYRESPFEWQMDQSGGSLALAVMSGRIRWPIDPNMTYPDPLHQLVTFMLRSDPLTRPTISVVRAHVAAMMRDPSMCRSNQNTVNIQLTASDNNNTAPNHQVPFTDSNGAAWQPFADDIPSPARV